MGHRHHKVEKADLLTSALTLCETANWSEENVSKMTHDRSPDPLEVAAKVLKDAFQQPIQDYQKLKNVNNLLQCIYKGNYIFNNVYRSAELFNALFKDPNTSEWRTNLSPIERHAVASFFSFGISKDPKDLDFAWSFRADEDHTYTSLISFIKENYFPSPGFNPSPIDRNKICAKILASNFSRNISQKDPKHFVEVFSDSFCPDLADLRLKARRQNKIGLLYNDTKDENKILKALKEMVPGEFAKGKEIIPYARDIQHFQGGLFFQWIKTDKVLQDVLTFISPTPQERITYTIWSRSRNLLPLNIKMEDLKEISILTLVNELTEYFTTADYGDSKDLKFRMKMNEDYFKKIYDSLPKLERANFVKQVTNEYLIKINQNPDQKTQIKKEGVILLESLHWWWNPKYIDEAIKKLKT